MERKRGNKMITIKSKREIELMKEACKLTAEVYEYIEKINENRDDVSYINAYSNISFADYPEILK